MGEALLKACLCETQILLPPHTFFGRLLHVKGISFTAIFMRMGTCLERKQWRREGKGVPVGLPLSGTGRRSNGEGERPEAVWVAGEMRTPDDADIFNAERREPSVLPTGAPLLSLAYELLESFQLGRRQVFHFDDLLMHNRKSCLIH